MAKDILKKDLYGVLDVSEEATEKEILKGYRKKALKCHPDKNPDNPKAAELFHELSRALEILTDPAAKAAYDQSRKAKKAAEARNKVLDSKRKKFKEDLEAREQAAFEQTQKTATAAAEKKLQAEIERLRKEGSRLLEQEQERLKEELKNSSVQDNENSKSATGSEVPRIKLKWKAQKGDPNNGGYNSDNLKDILSCYGDINTLLISNKRNGSAVVEFESSGVSSDILDETGLKENPFSIVWLSGKPTEKSESPISDPKDFSSSESQQSSVNFGMGGAGADYKNISGSNGSTEENGRDFESVVLMKMRQAEERKKLIEQMMKEDENND